MTPHFIHRLYQVEHRAQGAEFRSERRAPHLPRYQRSVANYARLLVEPDAD
jgi:hypothetical protein